MSLMLFVKSLSSVSSFNPETGVISLILFSPISSTVSFFNPETGVISLMLLLLSLSSFRFVKFATSSIFVNPESLRSSSLIAFTSDLRIFPSNPYLDLNACSNV